MNESKFGQQKLFGSTIIVSDSECKFLANKNRLFV